MCIVDGDIYLAGLTSSFGAGGNDILLQHWKSNSLYGSWTWGGADYDQAMSIASRGDMVYVAGVTNSYGAGMLDGVLIGYNTMDLQYWIKTWGGAENEQFNAVTTSYNFMTQTTLIHLTGYTDSVSSAREVLDLRFLDDGSLSWQRTWDTGGSDSQEGTAIATYGLIDPDIYIGGTIGEGIDRDLLLLVTGGNTFTRRWGASKTEEVTGVLRRGDSIVLSGWTDSYGSGNAALLASFSSTGDVLGAQLWHVGGTDDRFYSICGFANNGVLLGGRCVAAEGGTWVPAIEPATPLGGMWTPQAFTLGSPPFGTSKPLGTLTDITDAIIDTGGGEGDALISLHHIPSP